MLMSMVGLLALCGGAGLAVATAEPAGAWAWSPTISLSGTASCPYSVTNVVTGVWIHGGDGEQGWASLGASGMNRHYTFTFNHWPSGGGQRVSYWFGCSSGIGNKSGSFGLARPAVGSGVVINLHD